MLHSSNEEIEKTSHSDFTKRQAGRHVQWTCLQRLLLSFPGPVFSIRKVKLLRFLSFSFFYELRYFIHHDRWPSEEQRRPTINSGVQWVGKRRRWRGKSEVELSKMHFLWEFPCLSCKNNWNNWEGGLLLIFAAHTQCIPSMEGFCPFGDSR